MARENERHELVLAPDPALDVDIEEALKRENPKGRLWERCAQLRIAPPGRLHRALGVQHHVQLTLAIDEWELTSGAHKAWSRTAAEQLAARTLLAELEDYVAERRAKATIAAFTAAPAVVLASDDDAGDDEDLFDVDEEQAERLTLLNPKGQVFEWCQARKIARPRFEMKSMEGAVYVRAAMVTLGLTSPWFQAARRKGAEQAACEALFSLLPDLDLDDGSQAATRQLDPRSALNELQQRGAISAYRFDQGMNATAPPAPPTFTAIGRMTLPSGETEVTETFVGSSKKAAMLLAARELLARLHQHSR